jgi:hypothetical protein
MNDIVNRLRTNRECLAPCLMDEAADTIVRLTAERDEARREVCRLVSSEIRPYYSRTPEEWARHCGWNCFTEDGK